MKKTSYWTALSFLALNLLIVACGDPEPSGGNGSSGGGSGSGGTGSTDRVYSVARMVFPQTDPDVPSVSDLTISTSSLGDVSVTGAGGWVSGIMTPGYESYGYRPLNSGNWYVFEQQNSLIVLVKTDGSGSAVEQLAVGVLKSQMVCPTTLLSFESVYGLRHYQSGSPFSFLTNTGFRFNATSTQYDVHALGFSGTHPNFTQALGALEHSYIQYGACTPGCTGGKIQAQCTASPFYFDFLANATASTVVGYFGRAKQALFLGSSSNAGAIADYAGTYDGYLFNDPNGAVFRLGVTLASDGTVTGLTSGPSATLKSFSGTKQLYLVTGTPEFGRYLVTPVSSSSGATLWGTFDSGMGTANEKFFILNRRP